MRRSGKVLLYSSVGLPLFLGTALAEDEVKPDSGEVKPDGGEAKPDGAETKPDSGEAKPDAAPAPTAPEVAPATVEAAPVPVELKQDNGEELEGAPNYAQMSLDDLLSIEIDASAMRPHTLDDAPATVYVVPSSLIIRRGYNDLQSLLEDIPEFEMPRKNAAGEGHTFTIRGVTGNQKLTVLLDGVPITTTTGTPVGLNQNFSLANAKRVEVVLGPSSALYGADAFSAVVNIVTFRGDEIRGGKVQASYGQYNTTDDSVVVGSNTGDFSIALTASGYHSNEPNLADAYPDKFAWYNQQYKNDGNVRVSPFAPPEVVQHVGFQPWGTPTNAHFLNLRLAAGNFEFGLTRHGTTASASFGTLPEYILYVDRSRWGYEIETAYARHKTGFLKGKLELHNAVSVASYKLDTDSMFINNFSAYTPAYKYAEDLSGKAESRAAYHAAKWLDISGGVTYEKFSSLPKTTDLTKPFDPDRASISQNLIYPGTNITDASGRDLTQYVDIFTINYQNVGAFAEVFTRPVDKVALTAGARFDHNSRYGSTLNPRAGLVIGPFENTRAKLLYGEAFYAPSTYYAYQHYGSFIPDIDPNTDEVVGLKSFFWHLPNPDLQPEKLRMVEGSVSHHTGKLHLSANGYYTRISDLIVEGFSGPSTFKGWAVETVAQFVNRGKASMYGGTARVEVTIPVNEFTLNPYAAYTLSEGDIDGKKLPYAAKHTVKAGLDVMWRQLSLSTRVIGRSSATHPSLVDADGDPGVTPGSAVVNAHFLASDLLKTGNMGLAAYLDVRNLFDARYSYVAADATNGFVDGAPQDPRRIMIGLIGTFKE